MDRTKKFSFEEKPLNDIVLHFSWSYSIILIFEIIYKVK